MSPTQPTTNMAAASGHDMKSLEARLPPGFQPLLLQLSIQILRNRPINIYQFCANFFDSELDRRTLQQLTIEKYLGQATGEEPIPPGDKGEENIHGNKVYEEHDAKDDEAGEETHVCETDPGAAADVSVLPVAVADTNCLLGCDLVLSEVENAIYDAVSDATLTAESNLQLVEDCYYECDSLHTSDMVLTMLNADSQQADDGPTATLRPRRMSVVSSSKEESIESTPDSVGSAQAGSVTPLVDIVSDMGAVCGDDLWQVDEQQMELIFPKDQPEQQGGHDYVVEQQEQELPLVEQGKDVHSVALEEQEQLGPGDFIQHQVMLIRQQGMLIQEHEQLLQKHNQDQHGQWQQTNERLQQEQEDLLIHQEDLLIHRQELLVRHRAQDDADHQQQQMLIRQQGHIMQQQELLIRQQKLDNGDCRQQENDRGHVMVLDEEHIRRDIQASHDAEATGLVDSHAQQLCLDVDREDMPRSTSPEPDQQHSFPTDEKTVQEFHTRRLSIIGPEDRFDSSDQESISVKDGSLESCAGKPGPPEPVRQADPLPMYESHVFDGMYQKDYTDHEYRSCSLPEVISVADVSFDVTDEPDTLSEGHQRRDSVADCHQPRDSVAEIHLPRDSVPEDHQPRDSVAEKYRVAEGHQPRYSITDGHQQRDSVPQDHQPRDSVPEGHQPRYSVTESHQPRDSVPEGPQQLHSVPECHQQLHSVPQGPQQRHSVPQDHQQLRSVPHDHQQLHSVTQDHQQCHSVTQDHHQCHSVTEDHQQCSSVTEDHQQRHSVPQNHQQRHSVPEGHQPRDSRTEDRQQRHSVTESHQQYHGVPHYHEQRHSVPQDHQTRDSTTDHHSFPTDEKTVQEFRARRLSIIGPEDRVDSSDQESVSAKGGSLESCAGKPGPPEPVRPADPFPMYESHVYDGMYQKVYTDHECRPSSPPEVVSVADVSFDVTGGPDSVSEGHQPGYSGAECHQPGCSVTEDHHPGESSCDVPVTEYCADVSCNYEEGKYCPCQPLDLTQVMSADIGEPSSDDQWVIKQVYPVDRSEVYRSDQSEESTTPNDNRWSL